MKKIKPLEDALLDAVDCINHLRHCRPCSKGDECLDYTEKIEYWKGLIKKQQESSEIITTMWAITGIFGLYTGTWLCRKDAIQQHCKDTGKNWKYCREKGDRAVKVRMSAVQDIKPNY